MVVKKVNMVLNGTSQSSTGYPQSGGNQTYGGPMMNPGGPGLPLPGPFQHGDNQSTQAEFHVADALPVSFENDDNQFTQDGYHVADYLPVSLQPGGTQSSQASFHMSGPLPDYLKSGGTQSRQAQFYVVVCLPGPSQPGDNSFQAQSFRDSPYYQHGPIESGGNQSPQAQAYLNPGFCQPDPFQSGDHQSFQPSMQEASAHPVFDYPAGDYSAGDYSAGDYSAGDYSAGHYSSANVFNNPAQQMHASSAHATALNDFQNPAGASFHEQAMPSDPQTSPARQELDLALIDPVLLKPVQEDTESALVKMAKSNPAMVEFIKQNPDLEFVALQRDVVARQAFGRVYDREHQGCLQVIKTRAEMTNNRDIRADILNGGARGYKNGAGEVKSDKRWCKGCKKAVFDFRSRHVQIYHMQNPDFDALLIDPVTLMIVASTSSRYPKPSEL